MSESLFQLHVQDLASVPRGLPLIVLTRPMTDIGAVIDGFQDFLFTDKIETTILSFKQDLLLDYRARRPEMTFKKDRLLDYTPEELTLSLGSDSLGNQFLVLAGFEPDYRWERFADAILLLVAELDVSTTVWVHALPMPVPHTRPVGMTISGTREDLNAECSDWQPTTRIAASIGHLLEYKLSLVGEDVVGCALLLPHYLAGNAYPDGLLAAISFVSRATGLIFSTEKLRDSAKEFHLQLSAQISESEEHIEMVQGLERRYDSFKAKQERTASLFEDDEGIPSAEQLAHEFEEFLAVSDLSAVLHDLDSPEAQAEEGVDGNEADPRDNEDEIANGRDTAHKESAEGEQEH